IRPEVDEHDLPAQAGERERLAVQPRGDATEVGCPSEVGEAARVVRSRTSVARERSKALARSRRVFDMALKRVRVAGERGLEAAVHVEDDRERGRGEHDAEGGTGGAGGARDARGGGER